MLRLSVFRQSAQQLIDSHISSSLATIKTVKKYRNNYHSLTSCLPVRSINHHYHSKNRQLSRFQYLKTIATPMAGQVMNDNNHKVQLDQLFESTYQELLKNVSSKHSNSPTGPLEVNDWLRDAIDYNLKNGKRNRAKSLVIAFEKLVDPNECTTDNVRAACILGWCVELLQAYFLVIDDVMDNSITRRGQLSWYRKENVGLTAINDGIMLNNCIYQLLHDHFHSHSAYMQIVDLFNESTRFTAYGQCLDMISSPQNANLDLRKYDDERYDSIVRYKTAYYSFCLPIRLAMYFAKIDDEQAHRKAEEILLKIGHIFQVQDDFLDCYGDPRITGKIGTDIEDGKCSWLFVQALKLANSEQNAVLKQNYAQKPEQNVLAVKQVYRDLDLEQVFHRYEEAQFADIRASIEQLNDSNYLSKDVFHDILALIYHRKK